MSQDNDNKPDDLDFDPTAADQGNNAGTPFAENDFDPFSESGFSFDSDEAQAETLVPASDAPLDGLGDLPVPSSFLTGDADGVSSDEASVGEAAEEKETDPKGKKKKKKKEKAKKEKKPKPEKKKKEKKPGDKEPMGLGGILCLVFGILLLVGLIACNALLFMTDPKELGVGASSILYYVIGMDVIGLVGIVSVPFLLFVYRKEIDVFKVGLGVSAMAMSFGVILLLTAFFRYDFVTKPTGGMPSTDIPVSAPPAATPEE